MKHLALMVDDRLNFNRHVRYVCERGSKAITAFDMELLRVSWTASKDVPEQKYVEHGERAVVQIMSPTQRILREQKRASGHEQSRPDQSSGI